jgi:four helix bundle protein
MNSSDAASNNNPQGRKNRGFKDLLAWQRAMQMVLTVYKLTSQFPIAERFGLSGQIRRAAISVPSNIAEGYGRVTTGEFKQFLGHARGSKCADW